MTDSAQRDEARLTRTARATLPAGRIRLLFALPLFTYLLPLTPFLLVYSSNVHRIAPAMFFMAAGSAVIGYCALSVLLRAVSRRPDITDPLLASLFIGALLGAYFAGTHQSAWMTFWVAIAAAACGLPSIRAPLQTFMNVSAAVIVIFAAVSVVKGPILWDRGELSHAVEQSFPEIPATAAQSTTKRDIYYIVLDRYGRADQLREIYGFDNAEFLDALRTFGFSIADRSYSNYQRTAHSLSSSLNMDYFDGGEDAGIQATSDLIPIYRRIVDSRLGDVLTRLGFELHFFGSWWEPTRRNPSADLEVNYRAWPELARVVFENSIGGQIAARLGLQDLNPRQLQCRRARKKFSALADTAAQHDPDVPKFVFAHFLVPHPPFVIDGEGNCLDVETVANRSREQNYVEQVKYANSQVLRFIERIKQSGGPEPIIILQADEGPWPKRLVRDEIRRLGADVQYVDWLQTTPAELREKMAILNALYLPGLKQSQISAEITPVNSFRLVLREYFGIDLPALPDRSYVFPNKRDIYQFHDVTSKLQQP